jgi:hypothetical protein
MPSLPVIGQDPWGNDLNASILWLHDQVGSLSSELTAAQGSITTLQGQVAGLTTSISDLQTAMDALEARVTALETAPGAAKTILPYSMVSQTAPPPSSNGQMRTNNATTSQSTHLYVSNVTDDNLNVNNLLIATPVGAVLYLQERTDDTKWARFTVTANTAGSGYQDYTVTPLSNSGIEINKSTQKVVLVLPQ